jgi:putative FmdB family regulatory protein
MPHYEFVCRTCKKTFSRMLALVDWGEGEITCPHCVATMTSNNCGRSSRFLHPRSAREGCLLLSLRG